MQGLGSAELIASRYRDAEVVQRGGEALHTVPVLTSSDAKWVFVCCGSRVQVYSHTTHQVVSTLQHSAPVTATLLNPKNDLQLITSSLSGHLSWWDFTNAALLRRIDFGVPLHKFAIRPGSVEPSIFFVVKREEMSVVGMSSHAITERHPTTHPSEQLQDASPLVTTSNTPRDIKFTHQGAHLVTYNESGSRLIVYDFHSQTHFKYKNRWRLTAVACHPSDLCIATGNRKGEIMLWYDFARPGVKEAVTTLHWHAHAVAHTCFTTDGTYLLSGGEEGVLVLWQLHTSHQQFRPRLGSPITSVSCSPNDSYFTVSLANNVVKLVSGLNSELEGTLGSLKKAYVTTPEENGVRTGLVLHPHSMSLVLNSTPGFLQFYDTSTQALSSELDVVGLNFVSRTDKDPIIPTLVDHVAFTPSGNWMATVESRDDGKTSPELRMKFWKFVTAQQQYMQNTCVDPPHGKAVTSLSFQPTSPDSSSSSLHSDPEDVPLAVTSSLDNRFKVWLLVRGEEGEEEGEAKRRRKGRRVEYWACRSVSSYRGLPCLSTAFSQDGSLLAVNCRKYVTVWYPYSCQLKQTFSSPHQDEEFKDVLFGRHTCSQYLMASAAHHLHVWDLLSCRLLWRVGVAVSCLVVDPFTHLAAAFVHSEQDDPLLYVVDPSSPKPLAVHALPSGSQTVVGGTFVPQTLDTKKLKSLVVGESSTLYFITRDQVLLSLEVKSTDSVSSDGDKTEQTATGQKVPREPEAEAEKVFTEIFRPRKRLNGARSTSSGPHPPTVPTPSATTRLLEAPPHVLPPPTAVCTHLMRRLLPPATPPSGSIHRREDSSSEEEGKGLEDRQSSEEEERPPKRKSRSTHPQQQLPNQEAGSGRGSIKCKASNYQWLVNYFQKST